MPSIPHAEKLLAQAQNGAKLDTKDRRHVLGYLMATNPELASDNEALSETFQISDRMIRLDKKIIREEKAKLIKDDDIGLVIADLVLAFEQQIRDIEKSKAKCKLGSRDHLEHSKAIFDINLKKVKALQDLGYYPKNLGNMVVEKFEYKSVVHKDGSVDTRRVDMFDQDGSLHVERDEDAIEAEFTDIEPKQLSAPEVNGESSEGSLPNKE